MSQLKTPASVVTAENVVDVQRPEVVEIAMAHNVHPTIICLKWAGQRGQIAIAFSVKEPQYIDNFKCVTEDLLSTRK